MPACVRERGPHEDRGSIRHSDPLQEGTSHPHDQIWGGVHDRGRGTGQVRARCRGNHQLQGQGHRLINQWF